MAGNMRILLDMLAEGREIDRQKETNPPPCCPNDCTPLRPADNGKLHCPWDGWVWPDDA
jgi:hypothetical protein